MLNVEDNWRQTMVENCRNSFVRRHMLQETHLNSQICSKIEFYLDKILNSTDWLDCGLMMACVKYLNCIILVGAWAGWLKNETLIWQCYMTCELLIAMPGRVWGLHSSCPRSPPVHLQTTLKSKIFLKQRHNNRESLSAFLLLVYDGPRSNIAICGQMLTVNYFYHV